MSEDQITPHFFRSQFAQPEKHGFKYIIYPSVWVTNRLRPLCEQLEILYNALGGHDIIIPPGGGYRSRIYNKAIHAAPLSQHTHGRGVDFYVLDVRPSIVHATALQLFDEGKLKIGGLGEYPTWTHIDTRPINPHNGLVRWRGSREEN